LNFPIYPILAHGALGWWDDLIFLGIIVVFIGMMVFSWFRSRSDDFAETDMMPPTTESPVDERFELE
jgi:hypothetical protein